MNRKSNNKLLKNLYEIYDNYRKTNRVTMHLTYISLIILVFCIISKSYIFLIILMVVFILSLILFITSSKKKKTLEESFKIKCPKCKKDVWKSTNEKKMLMNIEVDDFTFDTTISDDKQILKINKYICDDCKFCFSEIDIYKYKKNELKLYSHKTNIDTDYDGAY